MAINEGENLKYLDVDEVETINNALNYYVKRHSDKNVRKLLRILPLNRTYDYTSGKPFDEFAPHFKDTLRNALNDYCNQSPAPQDLPNAQKLLSDL